MSTEPKQRLIIKRISSHPNQAPNVATAVQNLPLGNQKKLLAQEKYYLQQQGVSPMSRNIKREPVHARLGIKLNTQQRNRVQHFGTNTSSLMPKKRKRRNRGPKNQAQKRLNDIRKNLQNNMQKKTFHIQNLSNNSNNNNKQTFFKLRRQIAEPSDLTIHVNNVNHGNSTFVNNNRFKLMLNQQLQNQIKRIQQRVQDHELNMNIRKVTPSFY